MILFSLVWSVIIIVSTKSSVIEWNNSSPPKLSFDWYYKWKGRWVDVSIENKTAFYSDLVHSSGLFKASCVAPYPIQWNFSGFIYPNHWKISLPRKTNSNDFYILATNEVIVQASLRVTCEALDNSEIRSEMLIFKPGNATNLLIGPETQDVINSRIIPCPTLDPQIPVTLFLKVTNGTDFPASDVDNSIVYHPTEGFMSKNNTFNGIYTCRQDTYQISINAFSTASEDYQFYPLKKSILSFADHPIILECYSKSGKPVDIIMDSSNLTFWSSLIGHYKNYISFSTHPEKMFFHQEAFKGFTGYFTNISRENLDGKVVAKINAFLSPDVGSVKGKAVCVTNSSKTNDMIVLKEWMFEFVQTPKLQLNNYDKEISCIANGFQTQIQTMRCNSNLECSFFKSHCPKKKKVTRCDYEMESTHVKASLKDTEAKYTTVKYGHLNGLVNCIVNGAVRQWEFFEALNQRKYTTEQTVSKAELVRMDEVASVLYTNETALFVCETLKYFFAGTYFKLMFQNQSTVILESSRTDTVNISSKNPTSGRLINGLNEILELRIRLPLEAVGIECVASWWNSTDELVASRVFQTRHLQQPYLKETGDVTSNMEVFYFGEKNHRLRCYAKGEPAPVYIWFHNGTRVEELFPNLRTYISSYGESYLEFPEIQPSDAKQYSGAYVCKAVNRIGSVLQNYHLTFSDPPQSNFKVIFISVGVAGVILFSALLASVIYFFRRYKNAKQRLRDLTDSEVHDFFDGRPEVIEQSEPSQENIDFLPFNPEYEISFEDLDFSYSKSNLLGSGHFAIVVRGLILSKGKHVALKMHKPSTDVNLFKMLLSEVKIMSYIGEHENILTLIGVCTEKIRARCVYIATEICELGCLVNFLRKHKKSFVNLVSVNQEMDNDYLQLASTEPEILTTLDLISFSAQIANGMEFLADKSIVHADLAARNVLLTSSKVAKISDFGLSKKLYNVNYFKKKGVHYLPWRWMALESLKTHTFSKKSDVWSYGVTLYETFTLGDIPFPNEYWSADFLLRLEGGMRMGRPEFSTQEIFSKIVSCWEKDPDLRPDFGSLREFFHNIYNKHLIKHEDDADDEDDADKIENGLEETPN